MDRGAMHPMTPAAPQNAAQGFMLPQAALQQAPSVAASSDASWVQLGDDYLNLEQVMRVRFTRMVRDGQDELVAEIEERTNGEIQTVTRYIGASARALQAHLQRTSAQAAQAPATLPPVPSAPPERHPTEHTSRMHTSDK
jgi:hypothetical protein